MTILERVDQMQKAGAFIALIVCAVKRDGALKFFTKP
jgi:hypothetical protein